MRAFLQANIIRAAHGWRGNETNSKTKCSRNNAVAEWTKGTWLAPVLAALAPDARTAFEAEYRRRVANAYARQPDGRTLLPFRRLFIVAAF